MNNCMRIKVSWLLIILKAKEVVTLISATSFVE